MNKITERILNLMKDFGFTEYRLTQKANLPIGTLNKTLKAEYAWKQAEHLYKISKVFDVSMDFLILGTKTIQDENQRVLKLQQTIIKLEKESERLKERNKILEKALKAFVTGEK
ncbi:MAG: hypothetical protein IPG78_04105 [Ignavibacteria bacterium]|nr:hypothetical protein [Ignavibacteria bacterium]